MSREMRMPVDLGELFSELIRLETELWNAVGARLRAAHGLELSWFEPMQVIERTLDCRVQDIAAALSITVGGTSKLVDRIEAAGWCQRRTNPGDNRSSFIELTPAGRRLLSAANGTFVEELDAQFRTALSPRHLQQFSTVVYRLRRGLRSRSARPG